MILTIQYLKAIKQSTLCFMMDGWIHTESGGRSLGVEIHGMAYGFNCPEDTALNHALFMEYSMINRSENTYDDCYFGMWADMDLGNPGDDYIGSDPMRNMFFQYQGDNYDENNYRENVPTQGIRILDGIEMDQDNLDNLPSVGAFGNYNGFGMDDGNTDNEKLGLSHFMSYANGIGPVSDPQVAADYYNFMQGRWKDGTQLTHSGNGYDPANLDAVPARFMFTDSSDLGYYSTYGIDTMSNPIWDEASAGNASGDRRGTGSTGPFTFEPNSTKSITIAFVFAQKMNDRLGSVDKMKTYSDHIQNLYDAGETECGPFENDFALGQDEMVQSKIEIFPNPTSSSFTVAGIQGWAELNIRSIDGQLIRTESVSENTPIDISQLASGPYLLNLNTQGTVSHTTLIKQ